MFQRHWLCSGLVTLLVVLLLLATEAVDARFATEPLRVDREHLEAWVSKGCPPEGQGGEEWCRVDAQLNHQQEVVPTTLLRKVLTRITKSVGYAQTWTSLFSTSRSFLRSFAQWKHLFATQQEVPDGPPLPQVHDITSAIRRHRETSSSDVTHPYFGWIPMPKGDATPDGPLLQFSTTCFGNVTAMVSSVNTTYAILTVITSNQLEWFCSDAYLLAIGSATISIQEFDAEGTYAIPLDLAEDLATPSTRWYYDEHGVRFFKFRDNLIDTVGELLDTVTLLAGYAEGNLTNATLAANIAFLQNYVQVSPRLQPLVEPRASGATVARSLDPSYIQSGDALFVLRPDGLDPMIGWGEGDTVGHSTIALWINGTLNVCESTTKDAYWPTNGIQCHEWTEWVALCEAAQHNVLHLPLAPSFHAAFNASKAYDFFLDHEGVDYGFQVFVFGWLDTLSNNFPCVPNDNETCLTGPLAEVIATLVDSFMGSNTQNIFRQGLQHRVGVWPNDLSVTDVLQIAKTKHQQTFEDLYQMIERDEWKYNTTRNGQPIVAKSMVCCVFVCNMWKVAGAFGNLSESIQCGEQTLWDIFSMQLFDDAKMGSGRPEICQKYDPDNALCQLTGSLSVNLKPDVNTRPLYANMGERCSSLAPNYIREPGC
mmetsp:Transcript_2380/g.2554  ORF Transcript_2380/g.2554 Transcript_2380/m.2554 type:complete len:651 (+) Transcript_2380:63-2015(+)